MAHVRQTLPLWYVVQSIRLTLRTDRLVYLRSDFKARLIFGRYKKETIVSCCIY